MEHNDKFHLLDEYLMGRLQGAEKAQFEELLRTDSSLAHQASLQTDVLNGIGEARKKELKARLAAIPLPSAAGTGAGISGVSSWVYVGAAAIIIGGGVLVGKYLLPSNNDKSGKPNTELSKPIINNELLKDSETTKAIEKQLNDLEQIEKTQRAQSSNTSSPAISPKNTQEAKGKKAVATNEAATFEGNSSEPVISDVELKTPSTQFGAETDEQNSLSNSSTNISSTVGANNVETEFNKNYPFHYKNSNGRLTLSGDFKGKPYELLEIKNSKGTNYYLKYEGQFYLIENNKESFTKLELLTDKTLINQLHNLKKRK